ncbi:MAG: hypothetical protein R3F25_06485 [Gammaproteobacteria bacterium]
MRFNYFFKVLLLIHIFYSLNAQAISCPVVSSISNGDEATKIVGTQSVHLNEVNQLNSNYVYADEMDVELWVSKCVDDGEEEYSLVVTVTPTILGKSKGTGVYDIAVIQNNQQFEGVFYIDDNLYVSSDYWLAMATIFWPSGSVTSVPTSGLDLTQPFTLILSCSSVYDNVSDCSSVNPDMFFEIDPQAGNSTNTISSVNGSWHDPAYGGSGYNVVQTPIGYLMYFYGYKEDSNGEALWLISSIGPQIITKDETFTLDMLSGFPGNGGSLTTKPNTPNSGTTHWGTADVTFNDCRNGVVKLTKDNNTSVTHTIKLLAGIDGVDCVD